ncbi:MAG: ABC transporter permease [bacterium]
MKLPLTIRRTYAVFKKEFLHIWRDPLTLGLAFGLPVFMLIINGYAITTDVKHIRTAVLDRDNSSYSRTLVNKFTNSDYFDVIKYLGREAEIAPWLDSGNAKAVMVIPKKYGRGILRGDDAPFQVIIDGTDSNTAMVVTRYVNAITDQYSADMMMQRLKRMGAKGNALSLPINLEPRIFYNPELRSTNFLVPGLICSIMMILAVVLTSLSFVSEKERGTLEQVVTSPIKGYEFVIGKLLPYSVISFSALVIIIVVAYFLFQVPIHGNVAILLIMSLVFIIGALGQGLLISTIAHSGQEAFLMSFLSSLLPSFLLSGFIFPISNMPKVIQWLTYIIPARYFITITRGIFLKGVGWEAFWRESLYLLVFSLVMIILSFKRFKKRID